MTSPRRLLDEGTPFERDVLASARMDAGAAAGQKRTLALMSLGAAAATAASSIGSASIVARTAAGAGASVAPVSAGTGALLKWIALSLVVGAAVTTPAIRWVSRKSPVVAAGVTAPPTLTASVPPPSTLPQPTPDESPRAFPPSRSSAGSSATDATERVVRAIGPSTGSNPSVAAPAAVQGASSADVTGARGAARSEPGVADPGDAVIGASTADTRGAGQGSEARPRPASALYAELGALAGVRAALDKGDSRGALRSLAAYDSAFPGSKLAEEATVLRIDALAQGGDVAAAAALGRRFLAANPSSPHAPHVRRWIDDAHNP